VGVRPGAGVGVGVRGVGVGGVAGPRPHFRG
jgi:hypothetical protein